MAFQRAYYASVVLRLVCVLLPQTGYIHPDEFFQSPEIMARDILSLNTTVTWEWYESSASRSPVSAFLTSGLSLMLLKFLHHLNLIHLSSYLLLIFPRIFAVLITLVTFDVPVYVLSRRLDLEPFVHLFILSSSYVTVVLGSRPFSNLLETGLIGILLVLLVPCNQQDIKNYMSNINSLLAGGITALGFFCRQTFLAFALIPYLFCLVLMFKSRRTKITVILKLLCMASGFVLVSTLIIFTDSWYFGHAQRGQFLLTPWNLIKYNFANAHKHGHHPYYTHFLVNLPLLFGPLMVSYFIHLSFFFARKLRTTKRDCRKKSEDGEDWGSCSLWQTSFLVSPLVSTLLLSFIAHQEPRFLIPILLPIVLSSAKQLANSRLLLTSWFVVNLLAFLFYGILHQGGIIPSLVYLEKHIKNSTKMSPAMCHHVVYYHTYMPPNHLLVWPNKGDVNGHSLFLHDLAGSTREKFNVVKSKFKQHCPRKQNMLYVVLPGTVNIKIEDAHVVKFSPHLSVEDLPNINHHLTNLMFGGHSVAEPSNVHATIMESTKTLIDTLYDQIVEIKSDLSLFLYISKL